MEIGLIDAVLDSIVPTQGEGETLKADLKARVMSMFLEETTRKLFLNRLHLR